MAQTQVIDVASMLDDICWASDAISTANWDWHEQIYKRLEAAKKDLERVRLVWGQIALDPGIELASVQSERLIREIQYRRGAITALERLYEACPHGCEVV